MEEVFAPANAIDKRALKALVARSDATGLARLGGHLLALAATGSLVWAASGPWLLPAMIAHGAVLIFLFAPLHETIHYTAFRSRALNRAVAFLSGAALFLPSNYFRAFHYAHHRYTQDPARDPELARPKPRGLAAYLLHLSGLIYWAQQAGVFTRLGLGRVREAFIPARQHAAVVREVRVLLALYALVAAASVAAGSAAALIYWIGPLALAQPFLRGFLLAEHTGCPLVPQMLENSRTTHTNALVRALTWNMSYHAEHHAYPALPFHALPEAHRLLAERIAVQAPGYLSVHKDILARLGREQRTVET